MTSYEYYEARKIVNVHRHADSWFWDKYSAHPYLGCEHGCEYCYNREKRYCPYEDPSKYSKLVRIKKNAPELLRKELSRMPRDVVIVGDYQPIEAKTELSRRMLEVCLELGFPVLLLEKSILVLRDIDLIQKINRESRACVIFSVITTREDEVRRLLEPGAPSVTSRFEAVKRFSEEGISSGVAFMPILPFIYDDDYNLEAVVKETSKNGGSFVLAGSLTLAPPQREWYYHALSSRFPELIKKYQELYRGNYAPPPSYTSCIGRKVADLCRILGVSDRLPRYIPPGELGVNMWVAEQLHNRAYRLELDEAPQYKIWAYRRAAWSLEDLDRSVLDLYQSHGTKGLEIIHGIGRSLSRQIVELLESRLKKEV